MKILIPFLIAMQIIQAPPAVKPTSAISTVDSTWEIVKFDDRSKQFQGEVELSGFVTERERYIGEKSPHFYVSDSSLTALPIFMQKHIAQNDDSHMRYLYLQNENGEDVKELSVNSVIVKSIIVPGEGTPVAKIK